MTELAAYDPPKHTSQQEALAAIERPEAKQAPSFIQIAAASGPFYPHLYAMDRYGGVWEFSYPKDNWHRINLDAEPGHEE